MINNPQSDDVPAYKLYNPMQVGVAAFLGSPMAACWLIAHNYRQLGEQRTATYWVMGGIVGTFALIVAGALIRSSASLGMGAGFVSALYQMAKYRQGGIVAQHLSLGGRLGSWWAVIGWGMLFLVVGISLCIGIILTVPGSFLPSSFLPDID